MIQFLEEKKMTDLWLKTSLKLARMYVQAQEDEKFLQVKLD